MACTVGSTILCCKPVSRDGVKAYQRERCPHDVASAVDLLIGTGLIVGAVFAKGWVFTACVAGATFSIGVPVAAYIAITGLAYKEGLGKSDILLRSRPQAGRG